MAAPVSVCHVACCANRVGGGAVSWGRGGLLAFGSCRDVILYQPAARRTVAALRGHSGRVSCVRWARRRDGATETELVSGASDKKLILWEWNGTGVWNDQLVKSTPLEGHTEAVCAVDTIYQSVEPDLNLLIASAASDSTVRIWSRHDSEVKCIEVLQFGNGFVMDVSLSFLPDSNVPILACGGDDCKINLFIQQNGQVMMKCLYRVFNLDSACESVIPPNFSLCEEASSFCSHWHEIAVTVLDYSVSMHCVSYGNDEFFSVYKLLQ